MSCRRPLVVLAALVVLVCAGCGGRKGSWSREKAPSADNGDGVTLCIRSYEEKKGEVQVMFEVANNGDEPIAFGLEPMGGRIVHQSDIDNVGATTYIEVGGRRIAYYVAGKTMGAYDFVGDVNTYKTMAASYAGKHIGVGPHKIQRISLKFMPQPKLESAKAPLSLIVSDIRRGDVALKPLRIDLK